MSTPSRCRTVRRAVMALVVVVLLAASYVGWNCAYNWDRLRRNSSAFDRFASKAFSPLDSYSRSDLPGGDTMATLQLWSQQRGRLPWPKCHAWMRATKHHDQDAMLSLQDRN